MKYILENKKTNDVQHFFHSISTAVQSFFPRDQAIAKPKVFAEISAMEIDILSRDTTSANEDSHTSYENLSASASSELGSPLTLTVPVHANFNVYKQTAYTNK